MLKFWRPNELLTAGKGNPVIDFPTRLCIALGSAKGLAYLHEDCHPRIIHGDIKTANILLDNNFEALLSSLTIKSNQCTLAPEYASSGKLTDRSDVFSFGVMLLQLITGKQPIDDSMDDSLVVDWVYFMDRLDHFDELVDPRQEKNYNHSEMQRIRHSPKGRIAASLPLFLSFTI
ncbi:hypothetical protein V6N13_124863 [Hibiscus sabdariffa]